MNITEARPIPNAPVETNNPPGVALLENINDCFPPTTWNNALLNPKTIDETSIIKTDDKVIKVKTDKTHPINKLPKEINRKALYILPLFEPSNRSINNPKIG